MEQDYSLLPNLHMGICLEHKRLKDSMRLKSNKSSKLLALQKLQNSSNRGDSL